MSNDKHNQGNGERNERYLQHGYQPSGTGKPLNEGYVPTGKPSPGSSQETAKSTPPSGGSSQQDK